MAKCMTGIQRNACFSQWFNEWTHKVQLALEVLVSNREPCGRAIYNQHVRWQRVRYMALANHSNWAIIANFMDNEIHGSTTPGHTPEVFAAVKTPPLD